MGQKAVLRSFLSSTPSPISCLLSVDHPEDGPGAGMCAAGHKQQEQGIVQWIQ